MTEARRGDVRERREPVLDSGPKGRDSADLRLTADDRPGAPPHQKPRGNAADQRRHAASRREPSFAPVIMPRQGDQFETHRRDGQAASAYLRTARDARDPDETDDEEAAQAPMAKRSTARTQAAPARAPSGADGARGAGGGTAEVPAKAAAGATDREASAASAGPASARSSAALPIGARSPACGASSAWACSSPTTRRSCRRSISWPSPSVRLISRSLRPTERCSPIAAKPAAGQSP